MPLIHHELCFGCGRQNLFGLLIDAERSDEGSIAGRWFVKQDHQGPEPGGVHPGLLACALIEIATLAAGQGAILTGVEMTFERDRPSAVGSFCELLASSTFGAEPGAVTATASLGGAVLARLRADVRA